MQFKQRSLREIADMICGNFEASKSFFQYRSSSSLSEFFRDCDTDFAHDGSTRWAWVVTVLEQILAEPASNPILPPETFGHVIRVLMASEDALNEGTERPNALSLLNKTLAREGFEAFYAPDKCCYLRHVATSEIVAASPNPHRPFSAFENAKRDQLAKFLDIATEDQLLEEVLVPLFRQLGFRRVTTTGHKDKAFEYGKDLWMKFVLPTQHILYFGIQAKKDKIDAAGESKGHNSNVAEIHNQLAMMLGHEIFDPDTSKRVLVDHAFIVAGGEITKAARNWLGNKLDATKRSQIMFMDRADILNLFIVTNIPLPDAAAPKPPSAQEGDDSPPF